MSCQADSPTHRADEMNVSMMRKTLKHEINNESLSGYEAIGIETVLLLRQRDSLC